MSNHVPSGDSVLVDRLPYGESPKAIPAIAETIRDHLQITHDADDALIFGVGGYLPAAISETENRGQVALITQRRRQFFSLGDFPLRGKSFALGHGPVQSVTVVKYLDADDVEQTYPTASYRFSNGELYFKEDPPTLAEGPNSVWVDYVAGFGDSVETVPADWLSIVMQLTYRRYELRGESPGIGMVGTPDAWERMMDRLIIAAGGNRRGV